MVNETPGGQDKKKGARNNLTISVNPKPQDGLTIDIMCDKLLECCWKHSLTNNISHLKTLIEVWQSKFASVH